MKKLTKLLFAGFLAIGVAPVLAATFSKSEIQPAQVKADPAEIEVWNFEQLKEALEDINNNYKVINLHPFDHTMQASNIILGDGQGQNMAISLPNNMHITINLDGVSEFYPLGFQDVNKIIPVGLIWVKANTQLDITGNGTMAFYGVANSSLWNTVIYNEGTLNIKGDGVTLGGEIGAKAYARAIVQDRGRTHIEGGRFYATGAVNGTDRSNTSDGAIIVNGGTLEVEKGEFDWTQTNNDTAVYYGINMEGASDSSYLGIGSYKKIKLPKGKTINNYLKSLALEVRDSSGNLTTNVNQQITISKQQKHFTKQPQNYSGITIGHNVRIDYSLDFIPDSVDAYYESSENPFKTGINIDPVVRFDHPGDNVLFLRAWYTNADNQRDYVDSNLFTIETISIVIDFERGDNESGGYMDGELKTYYVNNYVIPECQFTAPPGKEFYAWKGHSNSDVFVDGFYSPGDVVKIYDNTVFTAVWRAPKVQFTVQPEGGVVAPDESFTITWDGSFPNCRFNIKKENGTLVETLDNQNARSYTFLPRGSTGSDVYYIQVEQYNADTASWNQVVSSSNFKVKWQSDSPSLITVTLTAGVDGTGDDIVNTNVLEGSTFILPEFPKTFTAPDDKFFELWVDSYEDNPWTPGLGFIVGDNDLVFTAQYVEGVEVTYTCSEMGVSINEPSFEHHGYFTLPEFSNLDVEGTDGKQFIGYEIDGDAYFPGDKVYINVMTEIQILFENIELTVSYNANGGSGAMASTKVAYGTTNYGVSACTFTAPNEYMEFAGWIYNGNLLDFDEPIIIEVTEDVILYATWRYKKYTLTYNAGEAASLPGNTNIDVANIEYGSKVGLKGGTTFAAPANKHFVGWAINSPSGNVVLANSTYTLTGNTTLFAIWEADVTIVDTGKYSVTYNANGGTGSMDGHNDFSGNLVLPNCSFTAPVNKKFSHWLIGGLVYAPGTSVEILSDTLIVAVWIDNDAAFTVSFNANGGAGTMANVENVSGLYTLPASAFTAPEGKEFAGWKINDEGQLYKAGEQISVSGNVTLYAQWKDIEQGGGETPVTPETPENPETPVTPETPEAPAKKGLSGGAIAGIVIGSVVVVGLGGFAVFWFIIKKKTFADLLGVFRKK